MGRADKSSGQRPLVVLFARQCQRWDASYATHELVSRRRILVVSIVVYGVLSGLGLAWTLLYERAWPFVHPAPWLELPALWSIGSSLALGLAIAVATLLATRIMVRRLRWARDLHVAFREVLAPQAEAVGVRIQAAEVRDVMLPGELRKAFSEVLKAKQEGQAALERARGESAALRNLANAARLIENQPSLATLRFLQTLEASEGPRTLVMNDISTLLPKFASRSGTISRPAAEG